jgi:translation initiation factor IF-1
MATKVALKSDDGTPPSSGTLEGTITEFASPARFKVDGQYVDAMQAQFQGGGASDLANGRRVGVAGTLTGGVLVASRVEFKSAPPATTLEVEGAITDYVSAARFKVQGQSVDASKATISGGTAADLGNGRKVGVVGAVSDGILHASKVEIKDAPALTEASVKGVITDFVSVANFMVAARKVDASVAIFEHGSAADLANGRKVEVEGRLNGVILVAKKVAFQ